MKNSSIYEMKNSPSDEMNNSPSDKMKNSPSDEMKNSPSDKIKNSPSDEIKVEAKQWPQYIAGIAACIPMLCTGCIMSWTSVALDHLQTPTNSTAAITNQEGSWIASIMPVGAVVGSLPAGYLADKIGRKYSILFLTCPMLIGWVIIICADRFAALLYVARFLCGFGVGGSSVVIPIYNEEISEVKIRGTLGCYTDFMISGGFLWTYIFGLFLPYFWLNFACLIPTVIFYLMFSWMPESPVYLLSKAKDMDAILALAFLRGAKYLDNYDLSPEILQMKSYLKEGDTDAEDKGTFRKRLEYIKQCLYLSKNMTTTAKAMRLVFSLIILVQLSGVEGLIYYTYEINKRGHSTVSLSVSNFVIGVVQFIPSLVSAFTVDKFGRRFWLLTSAAGMGIAVGVLAIHSVLLDVQGYTEYFGFMPCLLETVFISSYAAGCASLPWLLTAELVPTESKGWVNSICVLLLWTFQLIITQLFNILLNNVIDVITYSIFCFFCIVNVIYIALCIPETKHKSRAQIQNELMNMISKNTPL